MDIVLLIIAALLVLLIPLAIILEKKEYNKGICPKCGKRLIYLDNDSHGGRYYKCENKDYSCWINYPVDRNNQKKEK